MLSTLESGPLSIGGELRALLRLATPIALAELSLVSLSMVDMAIVGHDSTVSLAGASLGRSLCFAVGAVGLGLASGLEPIAAQAIAAGEPERAWRGLLRTLMAILMVWPAVVAAIYVCTLFMPLFGVEADVLTEARRFMLGQVPSVYFFPAFVAVKNFLQAHGKPTPVLVAALFTNVLNYLACSLLVRGDAALLNLGLPAIGMPALGTLGAGIATALASSFLFLWAFRACWPLRASGAAHPPGYALIFRLGLPISAHFLAEIGVFSLVAFLAAHFGKVAVGAHQIALSLASFTFMGALGVGGAVAVRVGRAVGQGRSPRREGLVGIATGGGVMMLGVLAFALMPELLVRRFTDDPEVVELGVSLIRLAAFFQFFDGVQVVASGALRGAGDVRFAFLANLFAHWFVGLPIALLLGFTLDWRTRGFWLGLTAGLVIVAVLTAWRFAVVSKRAIARL